MMLRSLAPAACLLGAGVWAMPTPAEATFAVQVFDDGVLQGGISAVVNGNSLVFSGATPHFSITNGSGLSNNPGSQGGSSLSLSSNEMISTTFGTAGGVHTIEIVLSQTGFTAPTGNSLSLSSSAGGSISYLEGTNSSTTEMVASTYQGFLDNLNDLFGEQAVGGTPVQNASATWSSAGTSSLVYSPAIATATMPGGTPFSLTDVLTFTFTLSAGSGQDTANASISTTATDVALPEPSPLVVLGGALVGFGLLRRRRNV
jgi:hypothetical protein